MEIVSGVITAILIIIFLALWAWAWSKRRQQDFEEAANLPFRDEQQQAEQRARKPEGEEQ